MVVIIYCDKCGEQIEKNRDIYINSLVSLMTRMESTTSIPRLGGIHICLKCFREFIRDNPWLERK